MLRGRKEDIIYHQLHVMIKYHVRDSFLKYVFQIKEDHYPCSSKIAKKFSYKYLFLINQYLVLSNATSTSIEMNE